jgi:type I restriction enzyme S subunit
VSRIDDLIAELCPKGVESRELQDLFVTRNGYTPSKSDSSLWSNGTVPWFRMEDLRENGGVLDKAFQYIPDLAVKGGRLFPANSILIATSATIGEHALITVPHLSNQRFTSLALKPKYADRFEMKFVYYYCFVLDEWCRHNTTTSSFASVDMSKFKKFRFPMPPLAVQRQIVSVLDKFTQLETELETELEARRRQYSYYRDSLLTFHEVRGVRRIPMGELGEFIRGNGIQKSDFRESGVGAIHYGQVHTHYGTWATKPISYVSDDLARRSRKARTGDLVIATTSEDDEGVGKSVAWLGPEEVAVSGDAYVYRHSLNPKYVAYFFQTGDFLAQKKRHITGTKVRRISGVNLSKILISVPSLEEQERIVLILDKFDTLVNDLSSGLPAELAARRKQYEHYRDRLLTFNEAAV